MESIIRAAVVYVVLLVLFRISGKRSLAEVTSFDLVLLLIISEATQQAMIDTLGVIRPETQKVLDRLADVPVDIEPRFTTAEQLLRGSS